MKTDITLLGVVKFKILFSNKLNGKKKKKIIGEDFGFFVWI